LSTPPTLTLGPIDSKDGPGCLRAAGTWTALTAQEVEALADHTLENMPELKTMSFDVGSIDELDTFGAWMIERVSRGCAQRGIELSLISIPERFKAVLAAIHRTSQGSSGVRDRKRSPFALLESIGRTLPELAADVAAFADMLGALATALLRVIRHPRRMRLTSMVHQLDRVGWRAMPIMLLISFLIGAIIAQQGIFHFRKFGADVYVVDLVGILVLREIGVLLIAIMSAGRSGSSYTAELGSMKMREEIDALRTMGLDPVEVLMLPRVLALTIALPILTFFGSLAALYGGGLITWLYGDMSPHIFISRLQEAVSITSFKVGMIKAPFMALVIGIVACSEGLKVKGSAESLGLQTTTSVVKSIFLVIVLDGLFAVFFASIGM
jgi:phospholipid/cholesterol/gamma-HCH transport system permease protein